MVNESSIKKIITLTFNKESYDKYTKHYRRVYPNRKKMPLSWTRKTPNGQLVSWNRFINSPNRIMQNQWKQEFADYTKFILEDSGLNDLGIERCAIIVRQYNGTKAKSDSDNIMIKASLDAMVKCNVIIEDNYTVLNPVILYTDYDKENPRTEIILYPITNECNMSEVLNKITFDNRNYN